MNSGKCYECTYWNTKYGAESRGKFYGNCCCGTANGAIIGALRPTHDFGCPYWVKKEPTLEERLRDRIEWMIGTGANLPISEHVSCMMDIFEDYRKGKNE